MRSNFYSVRVGCIKVMGKGRKERVVPIGKTALRFLVGYIRAIRPFFPVRPGTTTLFVNNRGRPFSRKTLNNMIRRRSQSSTLPINYTPHTFRRSCATELIRNNANLYQV